MAGNVPGEVLHRIVDDSGLTNLDFSRFVGVKAMTDELPSASGTDLARFLSRVDAFCAATEWPLVRLSRALFTDDVRIDRIRNTRSDVGVKRLRRAEIDLDRLAAEAGVTLPDAAAQQNESQPEGARSQTRAPLGALGGQGADAASAPAPARAAGGA